MHPNLDEQLNSTRRKLQSSRFMIVVGALWLLIGVVGLLYCWQFEEATRTEASETFVFVLSGAAILFAFLFVNLKRPDEKKLAQRIESKFPDLNQTLLTAVEQEPSGENGRLGYLQTSVVYDAICHGRFNNWNRVVSATRFVASLGLLFAGFAGLFALFVALESLPLEPATVVAANDPEPPASALQITVEPGDTEVEKGTSVIISAKFQGDLPGKVTLKATSPDGVQNEFPMTQRLADPLFVMHLPEVVEPFQYQIEFDKAQTEEYSVNVFEFPDLVQADADLDYPEYTNKPKKLVEDTQRVTVVEGTNVTWKLHLNKPVESVTLVDESGGRVELPKSTDSHSRYELSQVFAQSQQWQLELIDAEGRKNKYRTKLSVKVVPNRRPELKLASASDVQVSPLEEFIVQASFSDDFGVEKFGVAYAIAAEPMKDIILAEQVEGKKKQTLDHLLDFEALQAEPDQLLAYHFWVEDFGPDGKVRRTPGDMYFAEVRHFEEIFRQGQQQPNSQQQQQQQQQNQQQGQNAQQAEQLGQLQKQIINATWRVFRRETKSEVSEAFAEDVQLIVESQETAKAQLGELVQRLTDSNSVTYVEEVQKQMDAAIAELTSASVNKSAEPLKDAITAERLAYQGLLKLRARENEVVQSQSSSSSSRQSSRASNNNRFQQQLQQLQLDNEQNRYETERQAQEQESGEQRQVRQVLNRLAELAKRQEDINKQLKELETALQMAETEDERDELQRQLKRLRDQQQQMLRDVDELQSRMEEAQQQEAIQETQEQVEQSRENIQRASDALDQGDTSTALSAGTRAERGLKDVQQQLRNATANQFADQMRQMRDKVRELDEQQQTLLDKLKQDEEANEPGLRKKETEQDDLPAQLKDQKQKLKEVLDDIHQTVEEAETTEPLLAQKLYDAYRDVEKQKVESNLDISQRLLENGLSNQARQLSEAAGEGISDLRDNVEEAAESILGDGTEGLRRAVDEIERLANDIEDEINRNQPRDQSTAREGNQTSPENAVNSSENPNNQEDQQENPSDSAGESNGSQSNQNENQAHENNTDAGRSPSENQGRQGDSPNGQQPNGQQPNGQTEPNEPSEQRSSQSSERQNEGNDPAQPSENQQNGNQSSERQNGNRSSRQPSENSQSNQPSDNASQQPSESPGSTQNQQPGNPSRNGENRQSNQGRQKQQNDNPSGNNTNGGGLEQFITDIGTAAPITGDDFRDWSDRLRDVEEMVDDPDLRSEAARIRDRARGFRRDYKRHSKEPKWDLIDEMVAKPLHGLQLQVMEELLRRSAEKNAAVPIDRDPVPKKFAEQVRRYYERLGSGN